MALSDADAARLAALKAARDRLASGASLQEVQSGGRLQKFFPGDIARLDADIDALTAAANSSTGAVRRRGVLRFRVL